MKTVKIALLIGSISCAGVACANEVQLLVNKPMLVTFRIAHENPGGQPELGVLQSLQIDRVANITVDRNGYKFAGIVPVTVAGHDLPEDATRFNQPNQCSMTTDDKVTSGALEFTMTDDGHGRCQTHGGIFG